MSAPAASPPRLTKRREFLRVATGAKGHAALLSVQVKASGDDPCALTRVGFTASRKVGNAVARNRAKRRLREAVRTPDLGFRPGHDYVIVARQEAVAAAWPTLLGSLRAALRKAHAGRRDRAGKARRDGPVVDPHQQ